MVTDRNMLAMLCTWQKLCVSTQCKTTELFLFPVKTAAILLAFNQQRLFLGLSESKKEVPVGGLRLDLQVGDPWSFPNH